MLGRKSLSDHGTPNPFVFWLWFCVEICVDLCIILLLRGLRRRDTGVTSKCVSASLKGTKKRVKRYTLLAYPRAYMIFSELMWSMWSVAMLIRCALCSFGTVYCPFEYGIVAIFALPRMKKPPDLVSEGDGYIRCSRSLFSSSYDSKYDYFITRQRFLARKLRMHYMNKAVCQRYLHRASRPVLMPLIETSADRSQEKEKQEKFNLCQDDIPLGDAHKEFTCDEKVINLLTIPSVISLKKDYEIYLRLKEYSWMTGDSVLLTHDAARVLRDTMEDAVYLASGLRTIIIDTGASLSISNNEKDFPDGIEPCDIELQGIGSGLRVKGKGKVRWRFQRSDGGFVVIECMAYYAPEMKFNLFSPQSYFMKENGEGEFKMNRNGIYFYLNSKESFKISLTSANLPVSFVTHLDNTASENSAFFYMCYRCL